MAGFSFDQMAPDVDEDPLPGEAPEDMVLRVATAKALAVAGAAETVVVAADTTVVVDGDLLGKPADAAAAVAMLLRLSGRAHRVLTGWAVAVEGSVRRSGVEGSTVSIRPITEDEARRYAASGEPLDKAGAYALQGEGRRFVEGVEGSKSNVIGLPLGPVVAALASLGVTRSASPA